MNSRKIAMYGIVAALYVALTLVIAPLSYGPLQFRLSEVLVALVIFDFGFAWPLLLGTAIANLFSPLGMIDVVFGTLGTALGVVSFMAAVKFLPLKQYWQKAIAFVIAFGVIGMFAIAIELHIFFDIPLLYVWIEVMIGQIAVLIIGTIVMKQVYPRIMKK